MAGSTRPTAAATFAVLAIHQPHDLHRAHTIEIFLDAAFRCSLRLRSLGSEGILEL